MPKVAPSHLDARRRGILAAAARCFSRQGYQGTTMREICRAANLSAGGVYRYFSSKEEILEALARTRQRQIQQFFAQLGDQPLDRPELIRRLADLVEQLDNRSAGEGLRLDLRLWAEAVHCEPVRRALTQGFGKSIAQLGVPAGAGLDLEPERAARLIIALLQGLALQKVLEPSVDLAGIAEALIGSSGPGV